MAMAGSAPGLLPLPPLAPKARRGTRQSLRTRGRPGSGRRRSGIGIYGVLH